MRLETAMRSARDPVQAACLRAERAGFLARQGHFTDAQAELAALRARFDTTPNPAVSVWLCIVEGWMAYYTSLSASAYDKMKRALALSSAARLTRLQALSAAWLAHMDYVHDDVEAMARHAALALSLSQPDQHGARSRACLVVATAYHFAGRLDLAQPWYAAARTHAGAEGDDATLSALLHNMAWHRGIHALQAAVFGGDSQTQARHASTGAASTDSFDGMVGTASLGALVPMLRAVVASVQGRYGDALSLYESHLADARRQGLTRMNADFLADMAWCRWHNGDAAGAAADAKAAQACIDPSVNPDDLAIAHGRLSAVLRLLGDEDAALQHASRAREHWATHRQLQGRVIELLQRVQLQGAC